MLNGDNKLNLIEKLIWLITNFLNNLVIFIKPEHYWTCLNLKKNVLNEQFKKTYPSSSPSRRLCDIFWNTLPWDQIENLLGNKISAVEVGCGKGGYGLRLNKLIQNFDYLGCDIFKSKEWKERSKKNISFKCLNSTEISKVLNNKNFIFTQSAVEHFEFDDLFFSDLQKYAEKVKYPFLQIHLIPSPSCLWEYLWHGYRQYSIKKISQIYQRLWSKSKFIAVKLGGKNCHRVHIKNITLPMISKKLSMRDTDIKKYDELVKKAIKDDLLDNNPKNASFYALIIFSNIEVPRDFYST